MHHKRNANHRTMTCSELALTILLAFVMATASEAEATPATEDISIKTLPPDYAAPMFESANALLKDWEGDHWASLDADQDKVALSWTTTSEEAIFQVGHSRVHLSFDFVIIA